MNDNITDEDIVNIIKDKEQKYPKSKKKREDSIISQKGEANKVIKKLMLDLDEVLEERDKKILREINDEDFVDIVKKRNLKEQKIPKLKTCDLSNTNFCPVYSKQNLNPEQCAKYKNGNILCPYIEKKSYGVVTGEKQIKIKEKDLEDKIYKFVTERDPKIRMKILQEIKEINDEKYQEVKSYRTVFPNPFFKES